MFFSVPFSQVWAGIFVPPASEEMTVQFFLPKGAEKGAEQEGGSKILSKKRKEKKNIELRQQELEEENRQLMSKFNSLSMEIGYLKKLWEEVEKARTEPFLHHHLLCGCFHHYFYVFHHFILLPFSLVISLFSSILSSFFFTYKSVFMACPC